MAKVEPKAGGTGARSVSGFFEGLTAPLRGVGFFGRHPSLLPLAVIPIIINIIIFAILFYIGLKYFDQWLTALLPKSEAWYWVMLTYLLTVVLVLVMLLAMVFTFTMLANILASPFNDALSSKTEFLAEGHQETPFSIRGIIKEIGRTVVEELKKIAFFVVVIGLVFLLNLIPVAGAVLYVVLATLFTIFWLGLGFLDYVFARHNYKFGQKISFCRKNLGPVMGFGLSVFIGALVPVLNLAFFPMAVVGGTLLYLELNRENRPTTANDYPDQG